MEKIYHNCVKQDSEVDYLLYVSYTGSYQETSQVYQSHSTLPHLPGFTNRNSNNNDSDAFVWCTYKLACSN